GLAQGGRGSGTVPRLERRVVARQAPLLLGLGRRDPLGQALPCRALVGGGGGQAVEQSARLAQGTVGQEIGDVVGAQDLGSGRQLGDQTGGVVPVHAAFAQFLVDRHPRQAPPEQCLGDLGHRGQGEGVQVVGGGALGEGGQRVLGGL